MARTVRATAAVPLEPDEAVELWQDTDRWPGFVEGFRRVEALDADWPAVGAAVQWISGAGGRGTVREVVTANGAAEFATAVTEERLAGTQTVRFEDGTAHLSLEYTLTSGNAVVDLLFIRRALRDMLTRTLARFAAEAAEAG